jgi:hypothetical protein
MSIRECIKILRVVVISVFAFSIAAPVMAQASEDAPQFAVANSTTFEPKTVIGENTGAVTLNNPSRNLKLESPTNGSCTSHGFILAGALESPSTFKEMTLTCTNVKVFISGVDRTTLCPTHTPGAPNGMIVSNDMDGRLVWTGGSGDENVGMTFTPEAGPEKAFAEIEITGATCPLATGATPLKILGNAIAVNDSPTTKNETTQKISFPSTAATKYWTNQTPTRTEDSDPGLTLGATAATLAGTFDLHLASDELWSVGVQSKFEDAPQFAVANSTTFEPKTVIGENTGAVTLNNPSRNLKLESPTNGSCTSHGFILAGALESPSTFKEMTLTCTNVKVFISGVDRTTLCPTHTPGAPNGMIVSNDMDGRLVWTGGSGDENVGMTFTPEAGPEKAFAEIEITGATCPLATGATPLKILGNAIAVNDSPTTKNETTQKISFPSTAATKYWTNQTPTRTEDSDPGLTLGATAATLAGTFDLHLASDELWSVGSG